MPGGQRSLSIWPIIIFSYVRESWSFSYQQKSVRPGGEIVLAVGKEVLGAKQRGLYVSWC